MVRLKNFSQQEEMGKLECSNPNTTKSIGMMQIKTNTIKYSWNQWHKWMNIRIGSISWFILRRLILCWVVAMIHQLKSGKCNKKNPLNSKFTIHSTQWISIMITWEPWAMPNQQTDSFLLVMTEDLSFRIWMSKRLFRSTRIISRSNLCLGMIMMLFIDTKDLTNVFNKRDSLNRQIKVVQLV